MAEPLKVRGLVVKSWAKQRADGDGVFWIVKLEGSDTAYFDYQGKVKELGIEEGDYVEIAFPSESNTKILEIKKVSGEVQATVNGRVQHTDRKVKEFKQENGDKTSDAWRIARTSALKALTEIAASAGDFDTAALGLLVEKAERLAEWIVTGKWTEEVEHETEES